MAFVALDASGELAGIARLAADPDHETAEYGLLVRSDLQGHGLGWALLRQLVDYAASDGLAKLEGIILRENTKMLAMCRKFGFAMTRHPLEAGLLVATIKLSGRAKADAWSSTVWIAELSTDQFAINRLRPTSSRSERVTPPKTHSRSRLWPYAPDTMRSAFIDRARSVSLSPSHFSAITSVRALTP